MLRTKLKISDISNLTDARYFAAWGAEWMGFNADQLAGNPESIQKIKEMMEWVEGPEFVAEFQGLHEPQYLLETFNALQTSWVHLGPFKEYGELDFKGIQVIKEVLIEENMKLESDASVVILKSDKKEDVVSFEKEKDQTILLDFPMEVSQIIKTLEEWNADGLVLRGGEEEKVGFKSFDELDEIFEALEVD